MKKLLAFALLSAVVLVGMNPSARAVKPDQIKKAVDSGVEALRRMQGERGTWPHDKIGATALAGLTLLECDAADDDVAITRAADAVRSASLDLTHTYSIALSILFLDRLGDPGDVPLIESLMVRLLAGQNLETGGWTYNCPGINAAEAKRLQDKIAERKTLKGRRELPKGGMKKTIKDLPPEIQKQLEWMRGNAAGVGVVPGGGDQMKGIRPPAPPPPGGRAADPPQGGNKAGVGAPGGGDAPGLVQPPGPAGGGLPADNSNTQFAALAVWVGRRYGFPVEDCLKRLDVRFRTTQLDDGGWKYNGYRIPAGSPYASSYNASTATMTCAGTLCLAVVDGATLEFLKDKQPDKPLPEVLRDDKQLRVALEVLGAIIGNPRGLQLQPGQRPGAMGGPQVGGRTFYFLWSLERCAVALGMETIGKKDWYNWGAEILLENQAPNGAWIGEYADCGADTCFALLFLRKANLARDLTAHLRGKVKDPGERVLRGGRGGAASRGKGFVKSGIETKDVKPGDKPAEAKAPVDSETARLADSLVKANGASQNELLDKMQSGKGLIYTEALAAAIPQLEGTAHGKARQALAERLTRMKDETLGDYLQDEDVEIRRAAALAVAMKESKPLVPNLIPLLRDPEATVARAAHAALKDLTGQDFGPTPKATREERDQAAEKWVQWWSNQRKKVSK